MTRPQTRILTQLEAVGGAVQERTRTRLVLPENKREKRRGCIRLAEEGGRVLDCMIGDSRSLGFGSWEALEA